MMKKNKQITNLSKKIENLKFPSKVLHNIHGPICQS